MKKQISKPENWQDFEGLCKKLWGEIWNIPNKIKKNGRLGQPQSGVDVYGIPRNEKGYWGIQCKGKDEYVHAKLKKAEVDQEIKNATKFRPELKVFIIATSANKDVEIEEYVRIKDLESQEKGKFEILLFCWEDIVDLIEENRDTFNYYVHENQFRSKHDFEAYLNDFCKEIEIKPKFFRKIRRYRVVKPTKSEGFSNIELTGNLLSSYDFSKMPKLNYANMGFMKPNYNHAIAKFEIVLENKGTTVIEDWRVTFDIEGEFKKMNDSKYNSMGTGYGMIDIQYEQLKRTYIDENRIHFKPRENKPLIQKDNTYFEVKITPFPKEYTISIKWKLLARDFDKEGELFVNVKPEFEDEFEYVDVNNEDQIQDDEIISIRETEREEKPLSNEDKFKL